MSQLPDRPDPDQLRRQARELHRAAQLGDSASLSRVHAVSDKLTLSTAQLALAREYGFPSWRWLKDEAERRRTPWSARYPDLLTAEADELIAGQYADRRHLQPILDAVLAVLPPFGRVTAVARTHCVSFVSPRRTFAAAEATTKSRVDLGLRLDAVAPDGRMLAARNLNASSMNLRIALTRPGDVDDEVRGWLRRAYDASVAPPGARRPARRPGPVIGTMTVLIDGFELPGLTCSPGPEGEHTSVHVALSGRDSNRPFLEMPGRGGARALEPVPGDAPSARWELPVIVRRGDDGLDFAGPFVRGARDDRHLGLAWGDVPGDGTLRLFRGLKMRLVDVDPALVEAALRPGQRLVARIRLTDAKGNPICARVDPPYLAWAVEAAESA
ncbi:MAG TPA: DUF5990 family protein [Streptosporangiaceae bacterium]|nr:DUF5990 family protein [Streptosporangiaceae bacterium]